MQPSSSPMALWPTLSCEQVGHTSPVNSTFAFVSSEFSVAVDFSLNSSATCHRNRQQSENKRIPMGGPTLRGPFHYGTLVP